MYSGQWRNDSKHGFGVLFYPLQMLRLGKGRKNDQLLQIEIRLIDNGDSYTYYGEWCAGQRCGFGITEG